MLKVTLRRLRDRLRERVLDRVLGMAAHAAEQCLDADARLAMPPRAMSLDIEPPMGGAPR